MYNIAFSQYELKIIGENLLTNSPAGVIYRVTQDDDRCMDCPPGSVYNPN